MEKKVESQSIPLKKDILAIHKNTYTKEKKHAQIWNENITRPNTFVPYLILEYLAIKKYFWLFLKNNPFNECYYVRDEKLRGGSVQQLKPPVNRGRERGGGL